MIEIKKTHPLWFLEKNTNGSKIFRELLLNPGLSNYELKKKIGYYAGIDRYLGFMSEKEVIYYKKCKENGRKKHKNYVKKQLILNLIDIWYSSEDIKKRKTFKDLLTSKWEKIFSNDIFDLFNIDERRPPLIQIRDLFSQLWDLLFQRETNPLVLFDFKFNTKGVDKLSKILGIDKEYIYEGYLKNINTDFIDFMIIKSKLNAKILEYVKELIDSECEDLFETINVIEEKGVLAFNTIPDPRNKEELEKAIEKMKMLLRENPKYIIQKLSGDP